MSPNIFFGLCKVYCSKKKHDLEFYIYGDLWRFTWSKTLKLSFISMKKIQINLKTMLLKDKDTALNLYFFMNVWTSHVLGKCTQSTFLFWYPFSDVEIPYIQLYCKSSCLITSFESSYKSIYFPHRLTMPRIVYSCNFNTTYMKYVAYINATYWMNNFQKWAQSVLTISKTNWIKIKTRDLEKTISITYTGI